MTTDNLASPDLAMSSTEDDRPALSEPGSAVMADPAPPGQQDARRRARALGIRAGKRTVLLVLQVAVAVGLWQLAVTAFDVDPRVIPAPKAVWEALRGLWDAGLLLDAIWISLEEALLGFALAAALGIALGIVLNEFPLVRRLVSPYIVAFQAMPTLAVAPLFIIWFGFGVASKIALITAIVFFPVLVNTMSGLAAVSADQLELMAAYRASRFQTLRRVRIFTALPYIFASFEVCFVLSLTAAVVAELLGSGTRVGLGTLMQTYNAQFNTAAMFAVILVVCVLGIAMYVLVRALRRAVVRWTPEG